MASELAIAKLLDRKSLIGLPMDLYRSVSIADLEAFGYIKKTHDFRSNGAQTANRYKIIR